MTGARWLGPSFAPRDLWPLAVAAAGWLFLDGYWVTVFVGIGFFAVAGIGLSLLVGLGGMLSLVQGTFFGVGMYAVAKSPWHGTAGIGYALLVGAALALVGGAIFLRLRHIYFALGTVAAAIVLEGLARGMPDELGGPSGLAVTNDAPFGLATPMSYFVFAWCLVALVLITAGSMRRSRFGRGAAALGHDPELAVAVGVVPGKVRFWLYLYSTMLAVVAGAFYGHFLLFVSPPVLGVLPNIELLVGVAFAGAAPGATVVGVALVRLLPELGTFAEEAHLLILGAALSAVILIFPQGLRMQVLSGLGRRRKPGTPGEPQPSGVAEPLLHAIVAPSAATSDNGKTAAASVAVGKPILRADGLSVAFGGLRAVQDVTIELCPGRILGLIGPNGAGKTTLFNLLAGAVPLDAGQIWLGEREVSSWTASRRSKAGLTRTFQLPKAVPGTTVLDAVRLGTYRLGRSGLGTALVGADFRERETSGDVARQALGRVGLADLADQPVESLGTGRRKLIELARALAAHPSVLLLDEPAGGLEGGERSALADVLRSLADDGLAVLLVEHGMDLIMTVSDEVAVMETGRMIAHGVPDVVRRDPEVIRAYLG